MAPRALEGLARVCAWCRLAGDEVEGTRGDGHVAIDEVPDALTDVGALDVRRTSQRGARRAR